MKVSPLNPAMGAFRKKLMFQFMLTSVLDGILCTVMVHSDHLFL